MKQELKALAERTLQPEEIERRLRTVRQQFLDQSTAIESENFSQISNADLCNLFAAYDRAYFAELCGRLTADKMSFRWSSRMTRSGGMTVTRRDRRTREPKSYEIAISSHLLFKTFSGEQRTIRVNGLECRNRTDALMRVMEHELIHLVEILVWDNSSCSKPRFQTITRQLFGHTDYRHQLVTPREVAANQGLYVGRKVRFAHDGHEYIGLINRITKRATVLVEATDGEPYSNGKRYIKYYVPLRILQPVEDSAGS